MAASCQRFSLGNPIPASHCRPEVHDFIRARQVYQFEDKFPKMHRFHHFLPKLHRFGDTCYTGSGPSCDPSVPRQDFTTLQWQAVALSSVTVFWTEIAPPAIKHENRPFRCIGCWRTRRRYSEHCSIVHVLKRGDSKHVYSFCPYEKSSRIGTTTRELKIGSCRADQ